MLTDEQKNKIINRNYDWLHPYVADVIRLLPDLENSVTIEGIAMEWAKLDERKKKGSVTIEEAIKAYEKKYERDAAYVEKTTGKKLKPLSIPKVKKEATQYVVNEDLSNATIEALIKKKDMAELLSSPDGIYELLEGNPEAELFYGTEIDKDKLSCAYACDNFLDIISTVDGIKVDKFAEPNPYASAAIFGMNIRHAVHLTETALNAFRQIVLLADEMMVFPRENETRIAFAIHDLWKEHRLMSEEEKQQHDEDEGAFDCNSEDWYV